MSYKKTDFKPGGIYSVLTDGFGSFDIQVGEVYDKHFDGYLKTLSQELIRLGYKLGALKAVTYERIIKAE